MRLELRVGTILFLFLSTSGGPSSVARGTASEGRPLESWLRYVWVKLIRPHISSDIGRQRIKLILFGWGYAPLLFANSLNLLQRIQILARFLKIDWSVLHGHRPADIAKVCCVLLERPLEEREGVVEAGCWRGGSSAKLSILCRILGLRLHIYDSFLGVHEMSAEEARDHDFSGQYAAPEDVLRQTLTRYGEPGVCEIHKGWFSDTLGAKPVAFPVRAVYIDCDSARGTWEVLKGIVPNLVPNGLVFSQDTHLPSVRELLSDPETWRKLGKPRPHFLRLSGTTAVYRFG